MEEASCPQRSYDYAYANPAQVINSLILILFYSYIYLVIYLFSLTFTVFSRVNWRWIHDDGIRSLLPRGKLRFRLRKPRTNNKFFLKIWSCSFHLSLCLFIYLFSLLSKVLFRGNWHWIHDDGRSFLPRENLWLRLRKSCRNHTSFFNLAEHKNGVRSRWCLC